MRRRFFIKDIIGKILYTSTNGSIIRPYKAEVFGSKIQSNNYTDYGVITFFGSVDKIGEFAFYNSYTLSSIILPNSVIEIEDYAFDRCSSLTSITIPDSVTSIGDWAFGDCSSLTSITIPNGVTSIENSAFYGCSSLKEFKGKFASVDGRCLVVDEKLIFFAQCGLTEYTIPDGVTSIGKNAFYNCDNLTSITIPNGVTSIGNHAFYYCDSLTSVTIPDSVTTIGTVAFSYCTSLTSITIPNSVTEIGWEAFRVCSSLISVYCKATTPPALGDASVFYNNGSGRKIYVPYQSLDAYKTATNWSKYADDIVGYDFENDAIVGGGSLITFTMTSNPMSPSMNTYEDAIYQAEEGMSWIDWVNSMYNTNGFTTHILNNTTYVIHNYGGHVCNDSSSAISAEDLIESNGIYYYE